jgi:glutaredoxin 3
MTKVEIYTKGHCPFCHRAKALLEQKGIAYQEFEVDLQPTLRNEMIGRANGGYTVPQIFIGETHVGGCDDMFALESRNELDKLLVA